MPDSVLKAVGFATFKKYLLIASGVFVITLISGLALLWHDAKSELKDSELSRNSLKVRYDNLVAETEQKDKSDKATEKIIKDLEAKVKEKETNVDKVVISTNDKVTAINEKYSKLDKTDTNRIAQEREISATRIKGLWLTYCISNPSHERCAKVNN